MQTLAKLKQFGYISFQLIRFDGFYWHSAFLWTSLVSTRLCNKITWWQDIRFRTNIAHQMHTECFLMKVIKFKFVFTNTLSLAYSFIHSLNHLHAQPDTIRLHLFNWDCMSFGVCAMCIYWIEHKPLLIASCIHICDKFYFWPVCPSQPNRISTCNQWICMWNNSMQSGSDPFWLVSK